MVINYYLRTSLMNRNKKSKQFYPCDRGPMILMTLLKNIEKL